MPIGRIIELSDGRVVFLGKSQKLNTYLLGFVNQKGERLRLTISGEALKALTDLWNDPQAGLPEREFPELPEEPIWQRVESDVISIRGV